MTFAAQATLAADSTFIARITQAALLSATNVMAEAANTAGHAQRTEFALQVLRSPQLFGTIIAQGVVTNPVITSASIDSDLQFTVNTLWNAYSGVIL